MSITYSDFVSEAEYLKIEETARRKHEYVAGRLYAMSGATAAHNMLVMNLARELYDPVRNAGCNLFASDMKARVAILQSYYYPDIVVTCEKLDPSDVFVTAPCFIVEVLSPSTTKIDRREKLQAYLAVPSVKEYMLVHQDRTKVELHRRDQLEEETAWSLNEYVEGEEVLLSSLPCGVLSLPMRSIYRGLEFTS